MAYPRPLYQLGPTSPNKLTNIQIFKVRFSKCLDQQYNQVYQISNHFLDLYIGWVQPPLMSWKYIMYIKSIFTLKLRRFKNQIKSNQILDLYISSVQPPLMSWQMQFELLACEKCRSSCRGTNLLISPQLIDVVPITSHKCTLITYIASQVQQLAKLARSRAPF